MSSTPRLSRLLEGLAVAAVTTVATAMVAGATPQGAAVAGTPTQTDPTPTATAAPTPDPTPPPPTDTPAPTQDSPPPPPPPTSYPPPPAPSPTATPAPATVRPHSLVATPSPSYWSTSLPAAPTPAPTATATAAVLGASATSSPPPPTASTSVIPISGGGDRPSATATRFTNPQASVLTAASMVGTAALLAVAVTWRVLRPRRRARMSLAGAPFGALAVAPAPPDYALLRAWRDELDDIADLAALTVPREDLAAARERRRGFDADRIARLLLRSLGEQTEED